MRRIPLVILILAVLTVAACSRSKGPPLAGDYPLTRLTDHVEPIFWPLSVLLGAWNDVRVPLRTLAPLWGTQRTEVRLDRVKEMVHFL